METAGIGRRRVVRDDAAVQVQGSRGTLEGQSGPEPGTVLDHPEAVAHDGAGGGSQAQAALPTICTSRWAGF